MSKKYNTIFLLSIFVISLLGSMVSITEEVTPPALQAGDMSIMAQVTATNITLYMASSNSLLNVTSKITNFQQVNIISGTDTNILYQTFITNLYSQYLKSLQMTPSGDIVPAVSQLTDSLNSPITLYSLSAAGFKHLGPLPTLQTFLPKLKGFHPTYIPTQHGVLQDLVPLSILLILMLLLQRLVLTRAILMLLVKKPPIRSNSKQQTFFQLELAVILN